MDKRIITRRVVSYCDIPEELVEKAEWLDQFPTGCFVEAHIDEDEEHDELTLWLMETYPGIEEDTFLIEIDY